MDKKAISGVVVAILILLIAVIAVSIFWFALRPAIEKSTTGIGKGQECLILNLKIQEANAGATSVRVFRDAGEAPLTGIKVVVNGAAKNDTATAEELETVTISLPTGSSLAADDVVEIAGILEGNIICSFTDTATVA